MLVGFDLRFHCDFNLLITVFPLRLSIITQSEVLNYLGTYKVGQLNKFFTSYEYYERETLTLLSKLNIIYR